MDVIEELHSRITKGRDEEQINAVLATWFELQSYRESYISRNLFLNGSICEETMFFRRKRSFYSRRVLLVYSLVSTDSRAKATKRRPTAITTAECMTYCIRKVRLGTQQMPSSNTPFPKYNHPPTTLQIASMLWESLHKTWPHGCNPLHEVSTSTETWTIMRDLGSPAGGQRQTRGMLLFLLESIP